MKIAHFFQRIFFFLIPVLLCAGSLYASDEPTVTIQAQLIGDQKTDYEVTITVDHEGKSRSDHLENVKLLVNEVPVKVWQYSYKDCPKDFPLILKEKITISPSGPSMVTGKATCTSDGESDRASLQIIPGKSY